MSSIVRIRNSTKRVAFKWTATVDNVTGPLDLTGMTLKMLIDTEKIESTPITPVRLAEISGVITSVANGQAYFPITTAITGTIQTLYFEVWVTDANSETWPIEVGTFKVSGGLK